MFRPVQNNLVFGASFWDPCIIALAYEGFPLVSALIACKFSTLCHNVLFSSSVSSKRLILSWEARTRSEETLFKATDGRGNNCFKLAN